MHNRQSICPIFPVTYMYNIYRLFLCESFVIFSRYLITTQYRNYISDKKYIVFTKKQVEE